MLGKGSTMEPYPDHYLILYLSSGLYWSRMLAVSEKLAYQALTVQHSTRVRSPISQKQAQGKSLHPRKQRNLPWLSQHPPPTPNEADTIQ